MEKDNLFSLNTKHIVFTAALCFHCLSLTGERGIQKGCVHGLPEILQQDPETQ